MVNLVIVTHGEFGAYLVEAAEEIVGAQDSGVRCIGISPRVGVDELRARVSSAVSELRGEGGLVVVIDIPGGTPCNLAMPLVKDMPDVGVVSGLNLYMLVTAFNHRKTVGREELIEKMVSCGRRSVTDLKSVFLTRR